MDQTYLKAREALQPFVHLANTTNASSPRLIANLIVNATSSPNTFFFAELLETPAVQSLRSPGTPEEYQNYLTLLEIFAWGTWQEYRSTPNLPSLNTEQAKKLRLLSLLSLSVTEGLLTYETAMTALSISNPADLESLVTAAIYSSLITARLAPASSPPTIAVITVAPLRDVKPQSVSHMITVLADWESRCGAVISDIEAEIANIKARAEKNRAKERAHSAMLKKALNEWVGDKGVETAAPPGSRTAQEVRSAARVGPGGSVGSKREFSADEYEDDGYWEGGMAGPVDSRVDVDEGTLSPLRPIPGSRQAKRVPGRKS